ncbi:MAG: Glu/Leu/Phe/Val dehydrogenase dimerization domain-containing protein [Bradymonadaceae bacterium]
MMNILSSPREPSAPHGEVELIEYVDSEEGFSGFLAIDSGGHALSAGGLRMQPGLTAERIVGLARAMSFKQRLLGLSVGGAKCGIDYDPRRPGKREALGRFLTFLRPHLQERYSMGPDMGVGWSELESVAREVGIASVKIAIAGAQGLSEEEFLSRIRLLDASVGVGPLGRRRAGHGVGHAALAVLARQGVEAGEARVGLQGFGNLGWGTAHALAEAGVGLTAVADVSGCVVRRQGIDLDTLNGSVPAEAPPQALFDESLDVLILAAVEDAITLEQARNLDVKAVVCGANLTMSEAVENLLHERGIVVVPDFVAGCCGSASMDALFGPVARPEPEEVLLRSAKTIADVVRAILERSEKESITPRNAALSMAHHVTPGVRRPYGGLSYES